MASFSLQATPNLRFTPQDYGERISRLFDDYQAGEQLQRDRAQQAQLQEAYSQGFPRTADGQIDYTAAAERLLAAGDPQTAGKMLSAAGGGNEYGLSPVYGTDAQGNPVIMQMSKSGGVRPVQMPQGVTPSTGVDRVDLGTHFGLIDKRSGQMVGTVPKDIRGAESEKAAGKIAGEAQANLPSGVARAENTLGQIDELINHEGLDGIVGLADQYRPTWLMGDRERDALARYNQLKGTAFLEAFEMLKGGGQITEVEGLKAEQAMARMDRALNEEDFRTALRDFADAVRSGVQKLRAQASQGQQQAPAGGGAQAPSQGGRRMRFNPATGELE